MIKWNYVNEVLPHGKGYYLCMYRAEKKYGVFWFENNKWFFSSYNTHNYDRYGVKSVRAWVLIDEPYFKSDMRDVENE